MRYQRQGTEDSHPDLSSFYKLPADSSDSSFAEGSEATPDYADFEFYLRPTFDFRQELLSQCNEVEVLKPAEFKKEMKEMIGKMLKRYR